MKYRAAIITLTALAFVACSGTESQDVFSEHVSVTHPGDAAVSNDTAVPFDAGDSSPIEAAPFCIQETNTEFCSRLGGNCNIFNGVDNCRNVREVVNCGFCDDAYECVNGRCVGCVSNTEAEMCASVGKNCGVISVTDNCGIERTPYCGACEKAFTCTDNKCVANPCVGNTDLAICTAAGYQCGALDTIDNCGQVRHIADCGQIPNHKVCDYFCIAATHQCCQPQVDVQLCFANAKACGPLNVVDNCGIARIIPSCGVCAGVCADGVCLP